MTILSLDQYQACYFIVIYSDLMLGVPCISRSLKIIWIARMNMSFLVVLISEWSEDTEVKMCHAYFFSYHSQSKLGMWTVLTVNSVNHSGIWLLSQNIPGLSRRSLQVIASRCLPRDDLENWWGLCSSSAIKN